MSFRILVVDDQVNNQRYAISRLPQMLLDEGFEVFGSSDGNIAYDLVFEHNPDLIVLDIKFEGQDVDGWEICDSLRTQGYQGWIILRTEVYEETRHAVQGYKSGANVYVKKDCANEEIVALVRRCLPPRWKEFDARLCIHFDKQRVCVRRGDEWQDADLQPQSFKLFRVLVLSTGIVTSTNLKLQVWGDEEIRDDTLAVAISRLRERIESDPHHPYHIETVRGVGYRFNGRSTRVHDATPEGRLACLVRGCG